jgi:tetratricopeptide (TPR) repeat protein
MVSLKVKVLSSMVMFGGYKRASGFSFVHQAVPADSNGAHLTTVSSKAEPAIAINLPRGSLPQTHFGGANMMKNVREWLVPSANAAEEQTRTYNAPSNAEIKLLQDALKMLYGNKDPLKAEPLLTKAIAAWDGNKAPDERAALYHVRADCFMAMGRPNEAIPDYDVAVDLLLNNADARENASLEEQQATFLGRARALRSRGVTNVTPQLKRQVVADYRMALRLLARGDEEDYDSDDIRVIDGMLRNPYAAWEFGTAKRDAGEYIDAAATHKLASDSFLEIGDKARAVICDLDAGIDLAATNEVKDSVEQLTEAIGFTTAVEGRDVKLLQRVIAKEGEARLALASVLWQSGDKAKAEEQLATSCVRLEQLEADDIAKQSANKGKDNKAEDPLIFTTGYSIDDIVGAGETSCSRFKNEKYVSNTLGWPEPLQKKLLKFQKFDTTK